MSLLAKMYDKGKDPVTPVVLNADDELTITWTITIPEDLDIERDEPWQEEEICC